MTREKRTAQVKVHLSPTMREQLELFKAEEGGTVISMSAFLLGVIEESLELRSLRNARRGVRRIGLK